MIMSHVWGNELLKNVAVEFVEPINYHTAPELVMQRRGEPCLTTPVLHEIFGCWSNLEGVAEI